VSGCFTANNSPQAYKLIDEFVQSHDLGRDRPRIEEHESGPEILLFAAAAAGVLNISAATMNLITAIVRHGPRESARRPPE